MTRVEVGVQARFDASATLLRACAGTVAIHFHHEDDRVGDQLKSVYDDVVDEPVPGDMGALIRRLS